MQVVLVGLAGVGVVALLFGAVLARDVRRLGRIYPSGPFGDR